MGFLAPRLPQRNSLVLLRFELDGPSPLGSLVLDDAGDDLGDLRQHLFILRIDHQQGVAMGADREGDPAADELRQQRLPIAVEPHFQEFHEFQ